MSSLCRSGAETRFNQGIHERLGMLGHKVQIAKGLKVMSRGKEGVGYHTMASRWQGN